MIRQDIGFDGVLVSDDLSMQALGGSYKFRTAGALAAGCDVALHCSGDRDEMIAAAEGAGALTELASERVARSELLRQTTQRSEIASDAALERLQELIE